MSFTRIRSGFYVSPDRQHRIVRRCDGWVLDTNIGSPLPYFSVTCSTYRDAISYYSELVS